MIEPLLIANAVLVALTLLVGFFVLAAVRRSAATALSHEAIARAMRQECDLVRRDMGEQAARGRGELADCFEKLQVSLFNAFGLLGQSIDSRVNAFDNRLDGSLKVVSGRVDEIGHKLDCDIERMRAEANDGRDKLRDTIDGRLSTHGVAQADQAKSLRDEVNGSLRTLGEGNKATLTEMSNDQRERLDKNERALRDMMQRNSAEQLSLRETIEGRLDVLRQDNASKLEEMRRTVDEKLQSTLEVRLGESFRSVVEQLNRVHEGLGEMKSLATNVGDLRSVLTNVKVRGTYGEVQLALILEQFLAPHQYVKDARVNERTLERVEFAVKFPGRGDGGEVLLPIDAKFPRETFERLVEASDAGESDRALQLRKDLETQIRKCAKDIRDKYILPPVTTDFAVMFLPTESLYAEVLRQVGLFETLQRDYKVTVAGPTTLAALLSALQIGFRTLAIEKRSSEVWQVLGAVKTEFGKYNTVVDGLAKQLNTALGSVEKLGTRTRAMTRTLRSVHELPDVPTTEALLKLDGDETESSSPATSGIPLRLVGESS